MNRKKTTILLLLVFTASVGVISGLYYLSDYMKHQRGSFIRIYPPHPVLPQGGLSLASDDYYVAGVTRQNLYLARVQTPLHIIQVNTMSFDTTLIKLQIPDVASLKTYSALLKIDSPNFFLGDGAIPFMYKGETVDWKASRFPYDSTYFLDFSPLSSRSMAIRSYDADGGQSILGKLSESEPHRYFNSGLLEKQVDGFFCTDGILNYDKVSGRLVYVYYYRNEFLVMDSMLTLKFKGHTIDTFSRARIKIARLDRGGHTSHRLSSPPLFVNKNSCVTEKFLFIQSAVPAKNENLKRFDNASVIDIYSLLSGEYQFSFYLYDENNEKVKSLHLIANNLFAVYDHYIAKFQLNSHAFDI